MNNYDDIINHPAWEPRYRKRMSPAARAAQFAPFAALSGHKETLDDTARRTTTPAHTIFPKTCEPDLR